VSTPDAVSVRFVDSRAARWLGPLVLPAVALAGYQQLATSGATPYFPSLSDIAAAASQLWFGEGFVRDVLPSLTNLAIGYAAGVILGVSLGLLLGRLPAIGTAVQPVIAFGLTMPAVALLPVFLIVFGIGAHMQQAVITMSVFFVMVVNTADGVRRTDPVLLDLAQVYRLPRWRRILQIVLPAASNQVLAGARVGLSAALMVMVVGEMVGASNGIGAVTLLAQQDFAYARMWAGIVLLAVLGVVLNLGFVAVERRLGVHLGLNPADTEGVS
jgi:ABC-type nitrate/sulfonate/bicarbonate transport system permease component